MFGGVGENGVIDNYEFHERVAIIMEGDNRSEAEAIQMAQEQRRTAEQSRLVREKQERLNVRR